MLAERILQQALGDESASGTGFILVDLQADQLDFTAACWMSLGPGPYARSWCRRRVCGDKPQELLPTGIFGRHNRPIVLLDHPYNRRVTGGSIYRARDWREVADHIEALRSHAPR